MYRYHVSIRVEIRVSSKEAMHGVDVTLQLSYKYTARYLAPL